MNKTQIAPK